MVQSNFDTHIKSMIMKIKYLLLLPVLAISCQTQEQGANEPEGKAVVYQVFTRLFGNTNTTNKPWGTIEDNGVGKFNDFNEKALAEIKDLGVTHIWYTGVPHHAVIRDYTAYGISNDDPDVVKGRAGSPYAVKDYYNVNPDLAEDPSKRLEEFEALITRTHNAGMKVLIDIVPNHVARNYHSLSNPDGVKDFGADDHTSLEYQRDNNFYYIQGSTFEVPDGDNFTTPLGGESHPLSDGKFDEEPAKWTGNGSRAAQPGAWDWYETVKVNYGVRPDGTYDFPSLPEGYDKLASDVHYKYWQDKDVPDSWDKFLDIALYWTEKGVDGFRFDMAEMVPVEFWSYMNSSIKNANPDAFLLAEVYTPSLYRDYIHLGKMDYLYDKVELYDTLKSVMQGWGSTDRIPAIYDGLEDIEHHMLHFLENHDEQRIAAPEFAGSASKGKPAMVVSTLMSTAPTMIYFGQEVGEEASLNSGFGTASRTSIFDYCAVPAHQRWVNEGAFDGGQLSKDEKELRTFYKTLLSFSIESSATMGHYEEVHSYNRKNNPNYSDKLFSFVRWDDKEAYLVISNFNDKESYDLSILIESQLVHKVGLSSGEIIDALGSQDNFNLSFQDGQGSIDILIHPLESFVLKLR